jgi:hypothetical protein
MLIKEILLNLEKYSQNCRDRRAANDVGILEEEKTRELSILLTREILEERKVKGDQESLNSLEFSENTSDGGGLEVSMNTEVYQIPPKLAKMITPAEGIEFIVSLYPNPLRSLHTVFKLNIEGLTSPFFMHSQVAFALI